MTVTPDEVVWAYRMILGREPESSDVVETFSAAESVDVLRRIFLASEEFSLLAPKLVRHLPHSVVPIDAPRLDIETRADDETLGRLRERITRQWTNLGVSKPHYSVRTRDDFLPDQFRDNEVDFWESGVVEVEMIGRMVEHASFRLGPDVTAVELGCGVGRVTTLLAKHVGHVHAYDISQPHLDLAAERAAETGVGNIDFVQVAPDEKISFHECDLLYSRIVLQHNTPPIILATLDAAFSAIRPGGVALFQVPVYSRGYGFSIEHYINSDFVDDMEMNCIPQSEVFALAKRRDMDVILVREDGSTGAPDMFVSNFFLLRKAAA